MQVTYSEYELVRTAKGQAGTLDAKEVKQAVEQGAILIDVWEPDEWRDGHVRDALHIPRGMLEFKIEDEIDDKDARLVTYCAAGSRSALAAATLKTMGYVGAISSNAGFDDLVKVGLPIADDNE